MSNGSLVPAVLVAFWCLAGWHADRSLRQGHAVGVPVHTVSTAGRDALDRVERDGAKAVFIGMLGDLATYYVTLGEGRPGVLPDAFVYVTGDGSLIVGRAYSVGTGQSMPVDVTLGQLRRLVDGLPPIDTACARTEGPSVVDLISQVPEVTTAVDRTAGRNGMDAYRLTWSLNRRTVTLHVLPTGACGIVGTFM